MKTFTSNFFFLVGVLFWIVTGFLVWQRYTPSRLAFATEPSRVVHSQKTVVPTRLIIDSLSLTLPIVPAVIESGRWPATTDGVSYLTQTPVPGDVGNSVLYGHNFSYLLGSLTQVVPGDTIVIETSDGGAHIFTVDYTQVVTADQTHILDDTADSRITLYTCTGFLDLKRFVVVATKKGSVL